MSHEFQVYWAPGCTSCLRTKEFMSQHGIEFESINVVEHPQALEDLARIGFRSVPIVRRGDNAVFCQDLQDVADFVGVSLAQSTLSAQDFITKIDLILQGATRFVEQLSEEQLAGHFPGRDRPYRDLAYHIYGGTGIPRVCPRRLSGNGNLPENSTRGYDPRRRNIQYWRRA